MNQQSKLPTRRLVVASLGTVTKTVLSCHAFLHTSWVDYTTKQYWGRPVEEPYIRGNVRVYTGLPASWERGAGWSTHGCVIMSLIGRLEQHHLCFDPHSKNQFRHMYLYCLVLNSGFLSDHPIELHPLCSNLLHGQVHGLRVMGQSTICTAHEPARSV
jgi:hypothetical protein